jgi:hypothetical protein
LDVRERRFVVVDDAGGLLLVNDVRRKRDRNG